MVSGLQLSCENKCVSSIFGSVARALVETLVFFALHWNRHCLAVDHWQHTEHFLRSAFFKHAGLLVPPRAFQHKPKDIGSLLSNLVNFVNSSLGDFGLNVELVQFLGFKSSDDLLDGSQERLRIEESSNHYHLRNLVRIISERIKLFNSLEKIGQPTGESSFTGVGKANPRSGHSIE